MNKVKFTAYIKPESRHKLDTVYAYCLSSGAKKSYGELIEQAIAIQYDIVRKQIGVSNES